MIRLMIRSANTIEEARQLEAAARVILDEIGYTMRACGPWSSLEDGSPLFTGNLGCKIVELSRGSYVVVIADGEHVKAVPAPGATIRFYV